jgi:hypothetical protein
MFCRNGIQIADVHRLGPPGDQFADGGFISHRVAPSINDVVIVAVMCRPVQADEFIAWGAS